VSKHSLHGVDWTDEYAWMRDHTDPRFLAYLQAEREYYDQCTAHLAPLRDEIFHEASARLLPTDRSISWRLGGRYYYARTVPGQEYEQFWVTADPADAGRLLLDEAEFGPGYVDIGLREISPDGRLLAYSVDTVGDEVFQLRFRDTATGVDLPDEVARSYYTGAWSADSTAFFYTVHDGTYRPDQVWRHTIGDGGDTLVLTEPDARFELTVRATRSGAYVVIESTSRDTGESWLIPADQPDAAPRLVRARRRGIEYRVDHSAKDRGQAAGLVPRSSHPLESAKDRGQAAALVPRSSHPLESGDELHIVTNDGEAEFHLVRASTADPGTWQPLALARPGERLVRAHTLARHLVLELRRDGLPRLRIIDRETGDEREVEAGIEAGTVALATPFEYDAPAVTVRVESLVTPPAWFDVSLDTGEWTLRKRREVPGYDAGRYRTRRVVAPAPDGTIVPVTLAWRVDTPLDGTAPALLWGYGAYESCKDPSFDPIRVSLLDRGVVFATSHPRGGGENGRAWWEGGRLQHKTNTFSDHIAVAEALGSRADGRSVVDPARIATRGLSAGGLVQGVAYSTRPELWRVVVAEVPFVDVVTNMLDPTVPLTVNEWDEWGDPREPAAFALLRGYSPYDNVAAGPRPPLLVTAAMHDPRVMVHEPTKWVARLRATSGPDDTLLLRVELGAGAHTGPAGRYAHAHYEAEILAFVLDHLGATNRR
jgi:oligopeptidase B